jgi:hypothetical protein
MSQRMYEGYWQRGVEGGHLMFGDAIDYVRKRRIDRLTKDLPVFSSLDGKTTVERDQNGLRVTNWVDTPDDSQTSCYVITIIPNKLPLATSHIVATQDVLNDGAKAVGCYSSFDPEQNTLSLRKIFNVLQQVSAIAPDQPA